MKNFKLICIVIILLIGNLYIFTSITFNIKYKYLVDKYNKLCTDYENLQTKYSEQESLLEEAIAKAPDLNSGNNIDKIIKTDNIELEKIIEKIDIENVKSILKKIKDYAFDS